MAQSHDSHGQWRSRDYQSSPQASESDFLKDLASMMWLKLHPQKQDWQKWSFIMPKSAAADAVEPRTSSTSSSYLEQQHGLEIRPLKAAADAVEPDEVALHDVEAVDAVEADEVALHGLDKSNCAAVDAVEADEVALHGLDKFKPLAPEKTTQSPLLIELGSGTKRSALTFGTAAAAEAQTETREALRALSSERDYYSHQYAGELSRSAALAQKLQTVEAELNQEREKEASTADPASAARPDEPDLPGAEASTADPASAA